MNTIARKRAQHTDRTLSPMLDSLGIAGDPGTVIGTAIPDYSGLRTPHGRSCSQRTHAAALLWVAMTADADLLNKLSIDDYARIAFSLGPEGFGEGGIYAGPLDHAPDARSWYGNYVNPADRAIVARARLLHVPVGKVFVRWARSETLGQWKRAAAGAWWVTDNMANRIVWETVARHGRRGDSGAVAREYAQVKSSWSDMGAVVVCRTTKPIQVLFGVGRPVDGVPISDPERRDELQVIILTTIASPKNTFGADPRNRFRFIGDQFMENLWLGDSVAFTEWWERAQIVEWRRTAQRIALRRV